MKWTKDKVLEFFDSNWNATLGEIAILSGWSVSELKAALMELVDHETNDDLTR